MRGRLGEPHGARHDGREDLRRRNASAPPRPHPPASRVRPSYIVSSRPVRARPRVEARPDALHALEQLREPLERVVLALHRHDQPVCGRQRVEREQAERRRAIEDDVRVARRRARRSRGRAPRRGRARPGSSTAAAARSGCAGARSRLGIRVGTMISVERDVPVQEVVGRASPSCPAARRGRWTRWPAGRSRRAGRARRPRRGRRRR